MEYAVPAAAVTDVKSTIPPPPPPPPSAEPPPPPPATIKTSPVTVVDGV